MGVILTTLGLLGAAAAINSTAKAHQKRAYPKLNKNEFDAENARYGIRGSILGFTEERIMKIAARNSVVPNKHGILPENGWAQCIQYVEGYANSHSDVNDFKRAWKRTVQNQIKRKQSKTRNENNTQYEILQKHVITNMKQNRHGPTIVLELKHWHGISKEEHLMRMKELQNKTIWGTFCKEAPILRNNPRFPDAYTETWILIGDQSDKQDSYITINKFKQKYKICCKELGYEHGL